MTDNNTADHPLIRGAFYNVPQVTIGKAQYWNLKIDDIDTAQILESKSLVQQYAADAKRQYDKLFNNLETALIGDMVKEAEKLEREMSQLPNVLSSLKEAGDKIQFTRPPRAVVHPYVKRKPSTTEESD